MTIVRSLLLIPILTFCFVSSFKIVEQLDLRKETEMEDLDHYLENYFSEDKPFALLLDYDGTLAPIAPNPNLTYMTDYTTEALVNISSNPNVLLAIISGRGVDDVKKKVGIPNVIYGGNHGLEILYPNGTRYVHEIPDDAKENFKQIVTELENICRKGAWVENKKFSLTFHYRAVPDDEHDIIRDEAKKIIESHGYKANQAHCAIEAKPPVVWHKGKAADYILSYKYGPNWRNEIHAVFAGDDTTDEDIFEILKGMGVTFRVTQDPNIETKALYKLPSTEGVTKVLQWLDNKFCRSCK